MALFFALTDKSFGSLVTPLKVISNGCFINGAKYINGSR